MFAILKHIRCEIKLLEQSKAKSEGLIEEKLKSFSLLAGSTLSDTSSHRKLLKYQNKYPSHLLCRRRVGANKAHRKLSVSSPVFQPTYCLCTCSRSDNEIDLIVASHLYIHAPLAAYTPGKTHLRGMAIVLNIN